MSDADFLLRGNIHLRDQIRDLKAKVNSTLTTAILFAIGCIILPALRAGEIDLPDIICTIVMVCFIVFLARQWERPLEEPEQWDEPS